MGQYQQWLHYRHIDQQLQAQKEQLALALVHLQEQISDLDPHSLAADNHVIQALILYTKTLSMPLETLVDRQSIANEYLQQPDIISQTLFEHNRLSDLEPLHGRDIHETVLPKRPTHTHTSLPPIPHKAIDLVPEDASTVPDDHTPTEPQVALPWWLHKAALSATQSNSLDAQSVRTNHLVQRWLERWGRQEEQTQQSIDAHEQHMPLQQERQQS